MPRPVCIVLCESVVQDKDRNLASLFNLVERMTLHIAKPADRSKQVVVQSGRPSLSILVTWMREDEDQGKEFDVEAVFIGPNNKPTADPIPGTFTFTKPFQRLLYNLAGAPPLKEAGVHSVRARIKESGKGNKWLSQHYPFLVDIQRIDESSKEPKGRDV